MHYGRRMSWPVAIVLALLGVGFFIYLRGRGMAMLYADAHLLEVLAAIPQMKADAVANVGVSPPVAKIRTKAPMLIAYSVTRDGDDFVHHLSLSTTVTPSQATGAFFLALLVTTLPFEEGERRAFVTQTRVFHLVQVLSAAAHQRYAEAQVATRDLAETRARVLGARDGILSILETHVLPTKAS